MSYIVGLDGVLERSKIHEVLLTEVVEDRGDQHVDGEEPRAPYAHNGFGQILFLHNRAEWKKRRQKDEGWGIVVGGCVGW